MKKLLLGIFIILLIAVVGIMYARWAPSYCEGLNPDLVACTENFFCRVQVDTVYKRHILEPGESREGTASYCVERFLGFE